MFEKKLLERMQTLADMPPSKGELPEEDELNYYIYELLEDSDMESKAKRNSVGYDGYIKLSIPKENLQKNKYNLKDIYESLKFEKDLYTDYIKNNMDLSFLIEGDDMKIVGYKASQEDNLVSIYLKYQSRRLW